MHLQVHKKHLVQEENTPLTQCLLACLVTLLLFYMPADDTIALYMHTIPLPPVMLRINPFSLRLAPLMPCITLVSYRE